MQFTPCHPVRAMISMMAIITIMSSNTVSSFTTILPAHHTLQSNPNVCWTHVSADSALCMAKKRQVKKSQKVDRSRPQSFYDAIEDANDRPKKFAVVQDPSPTDAAAAAAAAVDENDEARAARARAAQERMEKRPVVSTVLVDEETGNEVIAQGQNVMDVVTRKAVVLSPLGPAYRLAQMFPGVPPVTRQAQRLDWTTVEVPTAVEALRQACLVNGSIPPHPSLANKAIDFVLANRDQMGHKMKRTLGRLTMRAASLGNVQEAKDYQALWKHFYTLENYISAPFRQIVMDAEGRVGPNFGKLDVKSYCNGQLYERCGNYLVLKGMVAHWEKKVVDADYVERTPLTKENYMRVLARGDPRRYLPDPPILFTLKECTQVCYMAQQMTKAFVETPELFNDLPVEVRFLEQALNIKGGTTLRQYVVEEFCPTEGIEPAGLREGLRRLHAQLENMQVDPYGDLCNIVEKLHTAMAVGTDDERDPYAPYLTNRDPKNGPGAFQTYTFDHEQLSLVRFLDGQYSNAAGNASNKPSGGGGGLAGLFRFGGAAPAPAIMTEQQERSAQSGESYKVPEARAAGRPHELGWLEILNGKPGDASEKDSNMRLGKVPAGRIIPDSEA